MKLLESLNEVCNQVELFENSQILEQIIYTNDNLFFGVKKNTFELIPIVGFSLLDENSIKTNSKSINEVHEFVNSTVSPIKQIAQRVFVNWVHQPQEKDLLRLDGCNVDLLEYDENVEVSFFSLRFGLIHIPMSGDDASRLIIKEVDTNCELMGKVKHFTLDMTGLDFTKEFNGLSKLVGVNWYDETIPFVVSSHDKELNEQWADKKNKCRLRLI